MTTESHQWVKSSYSSNGGACVEVAADVAATGTVPVRDSKDATGPVLTFGTGAWSAFVGMTKNAHV